MLKQKLFGSFLLLLTLGACDAPSRSPIQSGREASIIDGEPVLAADPIAASTVALYYKEPASAKIRNFCTGTVIGHDAVLTAAHCVLQMAEALGISADELMSRTQVGFGTNIVSDPADKRIVLVPVKSANVKPGYVSENPCYHDDLAVLRLKYDVPSTAKVAALSDSTSDLKEGESFTLAGFGLVSYNNKTPASSLMKTHLELDSVPSTGDQMRFPVVDGRTACNGDSGGPAYLRDATGNVLIAGVASWGGIGCTFEIHYTIVASAIDWIRSTLER